MFVAFYVDSKTSVLPMYASRTLNRLLRIVKEELNERPKIWSKKPFNLEIWEINYAKISSDSDSTFWGKINKKGGFIKNKNL